MKKQAFLMILGLTYGTLYTTQSHAPLWIGEESVRHASRSISSIPSTPLSLADQKITENLKGSEFEKKLASLFVFHSDSDMISNEDYFKMRQSLVADVEKAPKEAFISLKKAFELSEVRSSSYERSSLLQLGRALAELERRQMALVSLNYLEKEFPKSELNRSGEVEASALSLPLAAFEDGIRLKKAESKEAAKKWSKQLIERCQNAALKQAFMNKESQILEESV